MYQYFVSNEHNIKSKSMKKCNTNILHQIMVKYIPVSWYKQIENYYYNTNILWDYIENDHCSDYLV